MLVEARPFPRSCAYLNMQTSRAVLRIMLERQRPMKVAMLEINSEEGFGAECNERSPVEPTVQTFIGSFAQSLRPRVLVECNCPQLNPPNSRLQNREEPWFCL